MTNYDRLELARILLDDCSGTEKLRRICDHVDMRDNYQPTNAVWDLLTRVLGSQVLKDSELETSIRGALNRHRMTQPTKGEPMGGRA